MSGCCIYKVSHTTIKINLQGYDSKISKNIRILNYPDSLYQAYPPIDILNNTFSLNSSYIGTSKLFIIDISDSSILDSVYNIVAENKIDKSIAGGHGCGSTDNIYLSFYHKNKKYESSQNHEITITKK